MGGRSGDKVVQEVLTRHQQARETDEGHVEPLVAAETAHLTGRKCADLPARWRLKLPAASFKLLAAHSDHGLELETIARHQPKRRTGRESVAGRRGCDGVDLRRIGTRATHAAVSPNPMTHLIQQLTEAHLDNAVVRPFFFFWSSNGPVQKTKEKSPATHAAESCHDGAVGSFSQFSGGLLSRLNGLNVWQTRRISSRRRPFAYCAAPRTRQAGLRRRVFLGGGGRRL